MKKVREQIDKDAKEFARQRYNTESAVEDRLTREARKSLEPQQTSPKRTPTEHAFDAISALFFIIAGLCFVFGCLLMLSVGASGLVLIGYSIGLMGIGGIFKSVQLLAGIHRLLSQER